MKQFNFCLSSVTLILLWLLGFLIFILNYFMVHSKYNFSMNLFWISLIISSLSCAIAILKYDQNKYKILFYIALFSIPYSILNYLCQPVKFVIPDEIFHYQFFRMIYDSGTLNQSFLTFEMPKYFPGLELLSVSTRLVTGNEIPVIPFLKLFSIGIHSLIIMPLILLYSKILKSYLTGAIATIVYVTNPYFTLFDSRFSYQTIGIIYVCFLLYLLQKNGSIKLKFFLLILVAALVITHHLSSYIFLIILFFNLIEQKFVAKNKNISWSFFFLGMVLVFSWMLYLAIAVLSYYNMNILKTTSEVFSLIHKEGTPKILLNFGLPLYERIIDKVLYFPTLLVLYILGVVNIGNRLREKYVFTLLMLGFLFFATSPLLLTSDSGRYAMRTWSFDFIGLSLFVAITINKVLNSWAGSRILKSVVLSFVFIVIVVGGMSIGQNPFTRMPWDPNNPLHSTGTTAYADSFLDSGKWIKYHASVNKGLIGDLTIKYMLGGYSDLYVDVYDSAANVLLTDDIKASQKKIIHTYDIIAINTLLSKYPIFVGDVKDSKVTSMIGANTIEPGKLSKFGNYNYLLRNYDNGKTILYKIGEMPNV